MDEKILKQAVDFIKQSQKILILPSSPPDGDSIGSTLALYRVLKKLGKEVTAVCSEEIPDIYNFFPKIDAISKDLKISTDFIVTLDCTKAKVADIKHEIVEDKVNIIITPEKGEFNKSDLKFGHGSLKYDLIITVDTADVVQLGKFYKDNTALFQKVPVLNIDHHISNERFGKINMVDVMAASTTVILYHLINQLGSEEELIDPDTATLLLAGIITDTRSFQNPNTTAEAFTLSAHLVSIGARQQEIIQHVYKTKQLSTLKLWGRVLSKIKYDQEHQIVWSSVTKQDLEDTKSTEEESQGLLDELMTNAPGAEIFVLFRYINDNLISGSIRTATDQTNASKIANKYGGGGHVQAAGFKIESSNLKEVEQMVIEDIRNSQRSKDDDQEVKVEPKMLPQNDEKMIEPEKPKKLIEEHKKLGLEEADEPRIEAPKKKSTTKKAQKEVEAEPKEDDMPEPIFPDIKEIVVEKKEAPKKKTTPKQEKKEEVKQEPAQETEKTPEVAAEENTKEKPLDISFTDPLNYQQGYDNNNPSSN